MSRRHQGDSIPTGEESRLAKMKPPIYGHSHLHNKKCLLEGTEWWRYIALLLHYALRAHYALLCTVKKGFTFVNSNVACIGTDLVTHVSWIIYWQILAAIMWVLAAATGMSVVYGNYPAIEGNYIRSTASNVIYGTLSRFAWAIVLSWVVFACKYGYGGKCT